MKLPAALLLLSLASFAQKPMAHPRDKEINDPDTRSWWHYTESLSGDDMEGRDVGSPAYGLVAKVANDDKKPEWIK